MENQQYAKTSIDALIELLNAKGKSELNDIAITLGIAPNIVEDWAKVLDKSKIVKITNEFGKMYLSLVTSSKENGKTIQEKMNAQTFTTGSNISIQLLSLQKFMIVLDKLKNNTQAAEKIYRDKLPNLQKSISEINKIYFLLENETKGVEKIKNNTQKSYDKINKEISEIQFKLDNFKNQESIKVLDQHTQSITKILDKIHEVENTMDLINKNKTEQIHQLKRSMSEQLKQINEDINKKNNDLSSSINILHKDLKNQINEINKEYASSKNVINSLNKQKSKNQQIQNLLADIKVSFNDKYYKIEKNINKNIDALFNKTATIQNEIKGLNENIGNASKIGNQIEITKNNIDQISNQSIQIKDQIQNLYNELKSLNKITELDKKFRIMDDINKKANETKTKVSTISQSIKDTADALNSVTGQDQMSPQSDSSSPPPQSDQFDSTSNETNDSSPQSDSQNK